MIDKRKYQNREGARVTGGLILVVIGVALLLRNFGFELPYWLFTWPMILILVGIYSGVKHRFENVGWMLLVGTGVFFLIDDFLPNLKLEPAFWPAVIIGLGILFIIRPGKKNRIMDGGTSDAGWKNEQTGIKEGPDVISGDKNDFIRIDSVFSGVNRMILSKNFQGGKISCVFGGAEIDLSQADIQGTAVIKVDVVFGGLKLIVPANWGVQSYIDGAFQSVDDNRKYQSAIDIDHNKMLVLKGTAVFGGVEVKSY